MSEIKTITLKKSVLGSLKAMGESNKSISERYGVTSSEVNDAMIEFGFTKSRKPVTTRAYYVVNEDDITINEPVIQTTLIDAIEEAELVTSSYDEEADDIAETVANEEGF